MLRSRPLFIHRQIDRTVEGMRDSSRFRIRVAAIFPADFESDWWEDGNVWWTVRARLRSDAGILVPGSPNPKRPPLWDKFFAEAPIEEVLTAITITFDAIAHHVSAAAAAEFEQAISQVFGDEHLGYRMDSLGSVHLAVDEQFEVERDATIAALSVPSLSVARERFEAAHKYFDRKPQDTKAAAWSMFEALEVVAKQLVPGVNGLNKNLCRHQLRERHRAGSQGDAVEQRVWGSMFEAMGHWVDAMHQYRHGQVDAEAPPTEEFAVYALSSGSAYLRLLAQLAVRVGVQPALSGVEPSSAILVPPAGAAASD